MAKQMRWMGLAPAVIAAFMALPVQAQRGAPATDAAGTVEVSLQVAGRKLEARGKGQCKAAPQASIYDVRASLHSVSFSEGDRSLNMNLWKPRDGGEMVSLNVSAGGRRYDVDTVKGKGKTQTRGNARVSFRTEGSGGTFTLDAQTAAGERISGTVKCPSFSGIRAEGG